jgi:ATP-dependent Clp protease adapter protein ClpS
MINDNGDVIDRDVKGKTALENKTDKPPMYDVLVEQKHPNGKIIPCVSCVLSKVFNMHPVVALAHAANICVDGKDVVLTSTREIAESKTADANAEKKQRGMICGFKLRNVMFTSEPSV